MNVCNHCGGKIVRSEDYKGPWIHVSTWQFLCRDGNDKATGYCAERKAA